MRKCCANAWGMLLDGGKWRRGEWMRCVSQHTRDEPKGDAARATLILVGGGARSGKSTFALNRALQLGSPRGFVATAQALDPEMADRIALHRRDRGDTFLTVEEPLDLLGPLDRHADCPLVVFRSPTPGFSSPLTRCEPAGAPSCGATSKWVPKAGEVDEFELGSMRVGGTGRRSGPNGAAALMPASWSSARRLAFSARQMAQRSAVSVCIAANRSALTGVE